jgi:hypothetical protein
VELEFVLSEYDKWVTKNAEPLAETVLKAADALADLHATKVKGKESGLSHLTNDRSGFYQQHKLVAAMHFGKIAEQLCRKRNPGTESSKSPTKNGSSKKGEVGRPSSRWSDIRLLLDRASLPSDKDGVSSITQGSAGPKSVAARSAQKQQKLSALRVADATVEFHKFARWIYVVLKTVAEKRAEELEYQRALHLHHQLDEGTNEFIILFCLHHLFAYPVVLCCTLNGVLR